MGITATERRRGREGDRPSVRLPVPSIDSSTSAGGFAAERLAGRRFQSIAAARCGQRAAGAGAQQQMGIASC